MSGRELPALPTTGTRGFTTMIEALWSVEFASDLGDFGAGVVVFESGRIFGGDSMYYYVGSYELARDALEADVAVTHYAGEPWSIFGPLDKFRLRLAGKPERSGFVLTGNVVGNPDRRIAIRFTRRAELP